MGWKKRVSCSKLTKRGYINWNMEHFYDGDRALCGQDLNTSPATPFAYGDSRIRDKGRCKTCLKASAQ